MSSNQYGIVILTIYFTVDPSCCYRGFISFTESYHFIFLHFDLHTGFSVQQTNIEILIKSLFF